MQSNHANKDQYYKLIKSIRSPYSKQTLTKLETPQATYYGTDTLEGFASDAELLGKFVGETDEFDNKFYRLCIMDNHYIFEFRVEESIKIARLRPAAIAI